MLKVYCLPYAGGSKSAFRDWIKEYSNVAKIIPIEYSGHGELFSKPFYLNMQEMVDDVCSRIIKDKPVRYIVYGHSLGSMVALLTAEKLEAEYSHKPVAVVVGGMRPAHLKYKDKQLIALSKDEFMNEIFNLGQTDEDIMMEPELYDIIYDITYNDVKIEENYVYKPDDHKNISVPLFVMTGKMDDEAPLEDMKEWSYYTDSSFEIKEFESDHFFPFNCDDFKDYFTSIIKNM